jgi:hypothetical protein
MKTYLYISSIKLIVFYYQSHVLSIFAHLLKNCPGGDYTSSILASWDWASRLTFPSAGVVIKSQLKLPWVIIPELSDRCFVWHFVHLKKSE